LRLPSRDQTRQQVEVIRRRKEAEASELIARQARAGRNAPRPWCGKCLRGGIFACRCATNDSPGAAQVVANAHSFVEVGALGRPAVTAANQLLRSGLARDEACSLLAQAAVEVGRDKLTREEWLQLCADLYDRGSEQEGRA
jgi:hypothetical protein